MALCELVPEVNMIKGDSYEGDVSLENSGDVISEMDMSCYGVQTMQRNGQQDMQQMFKREEGSGGDIGEREYDTNPERDIQLLLEATSCATSDDQCNSNVVGPTTIQDCQPESFKIKAETNHDLSNDSFLGQDSSQPTPRRIVGRPHIATINVLRSPIRHSTPAADVHHTSDTKNLQRVTFRSPPTWSTSPSLSSTSSSKLAMSSSSTNINTSAFPTPSLNVRRPLSQVNAAFDVTGDVMPASGFYSSPFSTSGSSSGNNNNNSGNTSGETHRGSLPDYSAVSAFFTPSGSFVVSDDCREAAISVAKTHLPPIGAEQLSQTDDPVLMQYYIPYMNERENHNIKERHRRSRVAAACNAVRNMIPGLGEKTDKASVFEQAVDYLEFLKSRVGDVYDQDFIDFMEVARQGH